MTASFLLYENSKILDILIDSKLQSTLDISNLIVNSGKYRFSGFFQLIKTKMDFIKRILLRILNNS